MARVDAQQPINKRTSERGRLRSRIEEPAVFGALLLTPAVAYIVVLVGIPLVLAIAFSLSDVTVGNTALNFVGLTNFQRVWVTPQFQRALVNSFFFTVMA